MKRLTLAIVAIAVLPGASVLAQGRSPCAEGKEIITPENIGEF